MLDLLYLSAEIFLHPKWEKEKLGQEDPSVLRTNFTGTPFLSPIWGLSIPVTNAFNTYSDEPKYFLFEYQRTML